MAAGHHRSGPARNRTVLQHDVRAYREHRVGDAIVPLDPLGAGHVRPGVAVPRTAAEVGEVAPRRVGDDVAVVTEEWLDHREDSLVTDRRLAERARG